MFILILGWTLQNTYEICKKVKHAEKFWVHICNNQSSNCYLRIDNNTVNHSKQQERERWDLCIRALHLSRCLIHSNIKIQSNIYANCEKNFFPRRLLNLADLRKNTINSEWYDNIIKTYRTWFKVEMHGKYGRI